MTDQTTPPRAWIGRSVSVLLTVAVVGVALAFALNS
jgi:hypothetical protein